MTLKEFENKWLGRRTDQDGVYGFQCVDLIKQYAVDVLGVQPGAWGNAIDYWRNTSHPLLKSGFTRVAGSDIQRGDIVILSPTSGNPFGHIGIATSSDTMLEQNGASGDGDGAGGDEIRYRTIPKSRVAGVLRRKEGGDMDKDAEIKRLLGHVTAREAEVKELKKEVTRLLGHVQAREAEVKDLKKQIAEGGIADPELVTLGQAIKNFVKEG